MLRFLLASSLIAAAIVPACAQFTVFSNSPQELREFRLNPPNPTHSPVAPYQQVDPSRWGAVGTPIVAPRWGSYGTAIPAPIGVAPGR